MTGTYLCPVPNWGYLFLLIINIGWRLIYALKLNQVYFYRSHCMHIMQPCQCRRTSSWLNLMSDCWDISIQLYHTMIFNNNVTYFPTCIHYTVHCTFYVSKAIAINYEKLREMSEGKAQQQRICAAWKWFNTFSWWIQLASKSGVTLSIGLHLMNISATSGDCNLINYSFSTAIGNFIIY